MNPSSQFETRTRRPRGKSHTSNFHQWSQGGKVASSDQNQQQPQRDDQGYSYGSPGYQQQPTTQQQQQLYPPQQYQPQHQQYQQYQPQSQQHPSLQGYHQSPSQQQYQNYHQPPYQQLPQQHQPHRSYNPSTAASSYYGFKQPSSHHQVSPVRVQKSSEADIKEVKSKIIQARVRNLALKRAIVQRSLAPSGGGEKESVVRTQSASSSRSDLGTLSSDAATSDTPLPDAISELEDQLKKLKGDAGRDQHSRAPQRQEEETSDVKDQKKEKIKRAPPNKSKSKGDNQSTSHPDVPLLPLGNKKNTDHEEAKGEAKDEEQEEEDVSDEDERPKKKNKNKKKSKQRRIDAEKQAKEDEALTNSIDKIMGDVNSQIETNEEILDKSKKVVSSRVEGGLNAPLDSYRMKEQRRNEERKKRAEARDKIDSLLNNEKLEFKIPRWKHELNGNMNPKPELVLKGKSLFRMAAYLVMYFYAKPIVRVRIMRIMGRDQHKEDMTKATLLSLDTCASWLTTASKVPLTSIVQDQTLNLNGLQQKDLMNKKGFHQQCNLQLKVRVTAMVKGITKIDIDDVPPHIKSFLEKLVTDGNFFRTDFLYAFERSAMEFDKLGASNNVTKQLSNEEILERAKDRLTEVRFAADSGDSDSDADEVVVVGENTYVVATAKMLIRNFLFLRVFVTNILLSPWDYGIGPKPTAKQKKVVDNLRMVASVFYAMLRMHQPRMPRITHGNRRKTIQRMKGGKFGGQGGFGALGPGTDTYTPSDPNSRTREVIKSMPSNVSTGGDDDDHEDVKEENNKTDDKKKIPSWLLTFADKVLGEAQALNITEADDATTFLLRNRPPFDNDLEHLHIFLFGDQQLEHAKSLIEPWITDLANKLDTWIDSLTRQVIKEMKLKYQREHDI